MKTISTYSTNRGFLLQQAFEKGTSFNMMLRIPHSSSSSLFFFARDSSVVEGATSYQYLQYPMITMGGITAASVLLAL